MTHDDREHGNVIGRNLKFVLDVGAVEPGESEPDRTGPEAQGKRRQHQVLGGEKTIFHRVESAGFGANYNERSRVVKDINLGVGVAVDAHIKTKRRMGRGK